MHIADGVLSGPVIAVASVAAIGGIGVGLRALAPERLPLVAVLSAAFFAASLIHINVGPSGIHLILNGLIGVLLGWAAFPAVLVGLTANHAYITLDGGLNLSAVSNYPGLTFDA